MLSSRHRLDSLYVIYLHTPIVYVSRVEQWDVQNEMLHEHYYEDKLKNRTFTMDMFKLARSVDPDVKLYINDYQGITTGAQTQVRAQFGFLVAAHVALSGHNERCA